MHRVPHGARTRITFSCDKRCFDSAWHRLSTGFTTVSQPNVRTIHFHSAEGLVPKMETPEKIKLFSAPLLPIADREWTDGGLMQNAHAVRFLLPAFLLGLVCHIVNAD